MADFIKVTDDLGREVSIPFPPQRIIPAVPSTTEFLFDLGLEGKVISRTKFCQYPKGKIEKLPNIGGPKNLYIDKINLLNPELMLLSSEPYPFEKFFPMLKLNWQMERCSHGMNRTCCKQQIIL